MEEKILEILTLNEGSMTSTEIAKKAGKKKAKDITSSLQKLRSKDVVRKVKVGNRIYWTVEEDSTGVTIEQVDQSSEMQCKNDDKICGNECDTHQMIIDTLQNEIHFLRSELTAKNFHIDRLLDLVSKENISEKLPRHDKICESGIDNVDRQTCDDLPQNDVHAAADLNNITNDNVFVSPKKFAKVSPSKLNTLPLSNRFGVWTDWSDDLVESSEVDITSALPVNHASVNSEQCRRPSVVVNNYPESESNFISSKQSPKSKPSKPLVAVIGDSMTKWCTGYDIRAHCNYARVMVKPFLGAQIVDIYDYIRPILRESPKLIVLHVLTNDVSYEDYSNSDEVVNNLKHLVEYIQSLGIVVVVSLPVHRSDEYSERIKEIVPKVIKLCQSLLVNYVDNRNINNTHLNGSGLHLNKDGTKLLCRNIGQFLDFLLPKIFTDDY